MKDMPQESPQTENEDSKDVQQQLLSILAEEVASHSIDEQDMLLLSLRLGLKSEKCYTLAETGRILYLSSERVRQRQYFLLWRKIKNPLFFKLLEVYGLSKKLPPGFQPHNLP